MMPLGSVLQPQTRLIKRHVITLRRTSEPRARGERSWGVVKRGIIEIDIKMSALDGNPL